MKWHGLEIPEKLFGLDSALLLTFLPLLGVVLLIIVSSNLFLVPKFEEFNTLRDQAAGLNSQTGKLLEKITYLQSVDQDELKKNAHFISSALLPQKNAYLLVGVVRRIADKYGYQIESFLVNPGKVNETDDKKSKNGQMVPVTVTLIGPGDKYLELIKGLERSLPILSLNNFEMKKSAETAKLELQVSAYYLDAEGKVDINRLSLSDLTLKKEETALLKTLSEYTKLEAAGDGEIRVGNFKPYGRTDPFSEQ